MSTREQNATRAERVKKALEDNPLQPKVIAVRRGPNRRKNRATMALLRSHLGHAKRDRATAEQQCLATERRRASAKVAKASRRRNRS